MKLACLSRLFTTLMSLVMKLLLYAKILNSVMENIVKELNVQILINAHMIGSSVLKANAWILALLEGVQVVNLDNALMNNQMVSVIKILIVGDKTGVALGSNVLMNV